MAHPLFLNPVDDESSGGGAEVAGTDEMVATGGFAILTPAAFAILRSSFSSRLRSFSLRLLISSSVLRLARCATFMSRKRTLW